MFAIYLILSIYTGFRAEKGSLFGQMAVPK